MSNVSFTRFSELDEHSVNRDLHVHTVETDGTGTIAENLKRAKEISLVEIAFTDHIRRTSTYYAEYTEQVRSAGRSTPELNVLLGFEAKAEDEDGTLDAPAGAIESADIRLGSVHRFPDGNGGLIAADNFSFEEASEIEYRLAMGLVQHAPIDVLSHPGGMCLRAFREFPDEMMLSLMEATLKRGIAIEINRSYTIDMDHFLNLCREVDPIVSIGSDAHNISDLGDCRDALKERGIG